VWLKEQWDGDAKLDVVFYDKFAYNINSKGVIFMPNIKPVSDLRNYSEVLKDISVGSPVFLTKNGRGRYAIVDMEEYEKMQATIRLMSELEKGKKSGREQGWVSNDNVER
jgi:prevent-host-death family protein